MTSRTETLTDLLQFWGRGDVSARDQLLPLLYRELKRRAAAFLRRERRGHTLQPTALVHEAYLRLAGQNRVASQNQAHFFAIAAQIMRRILIDHAREHLAAKRPDAAVRVLLDEGIGASQPIDCEVLLLNQALEELSRFDQRQAQIVELRYFGGMTEKDDRALLHEVESLLEAHPQAGDFVQRPVIDVLVA